MTDLPAENEYPKLVRDKIPQIIIEADGRTVPTRVLTDGTEFQAYLQKKIAEEAQELAEAETDSNIAEEIADVYEVIDALLKLKNIPREDVLKIQAEKRNKRGGFEQRLLMLNND